MNRFLIIFALIFLYKLLINIGRLMRIIVLHKYFLSICTVKVNPKAWETKKEVIDLFKNAGIEDGSIPITEYMGYGKVVQYQASLFTAYPNNRSNFVFHYFSMFDEAKGIFKHRIFECFNPFYWIDLIIFAPKKLLNYIGVSPEERSAKILNIVLTFIYWIFGIFVAVLKDKIQTFILSYFP